MTQPQQQLFDPYFSTEPMCRIFSDQGRVQAMLDVEAALARAQAKVGLIPLDAAEVIARHCRAERIDMAQLADAISSAGNSAIPLVKLLGEQVAADSLEAERYLHLGATSQDVMDTGLVLQLREALALFDQNLRQLGETLATLARQHQDTVMPGRTWLQQATPVTLGMKVAGWLGAVSRHRQRLAEFRPRVLALQLGGASGSLAALGEEAWLVSEQLAEVLQLTLPEQPWHTQRDRLAELAGWLGSLAGSLGKMGRDISLLMQTEAGEAFEASAPGKGGSSTMPHKRNPVGAAVLISAATRAPGLVATMLAAMPQEHERSLGLWHAEWETLPQLCRLLAGAVQQAAQLTKGLGVDALRMRDNLELTQGLVLAEAVSIELARHIGRHQAHVLLERCCRQAVERGVHLNQILQADPEIGQHLTAADIQRLLDPGAYLGQARRWVEQACELHLQCNQQETTCRTC